MVSKIRGLALAPVTLAVASILSGCSVLQQSRAFRQAAQDASQQLVTQQQRFAATLNDAGARRAAQEVNRPWLAGRAQPLAREVTLPEALRTHVKTALMFPDNRVDLPALAERVTQATGIPVRIHPDALLPVERFLPRLAGSTAGTQLVARRPAFILPTGAQPLAQVLDHAAAHLGVWWRYQHGAIEIYRTETRVFNVRALLLRASSVASLGMTGPSGSSGAFASASNTRVESTVDDVMDAVVARIEPFLTEAGVVAAHGDGSSLVVVTDTPAALDRVAAFLERENRALTRRVRLLFEEVSVVLNEEGEAGIDWNLIYAASRAAATASSGGAVLGQVAGSLSASLSDGRWEGSSAIIQALRQVGTVTRHTRVPLTTLNRRPVTHAVRTTFSWIDRVQTTSVSTTREGGVSGALPSVSVSQKEETVGQFLTVIPDAQEDGQVLLSIAYDSTVAQPLTSVKFGQGDNAIEIQQLTVDGSGTVQQLELRPGQPVIVAGLDRQYTQTDRRRLDEDAPMLLGGSSRSARGRETTLLILTAAVEEGF